LLKSIPFPSFPTSLIARNHQPQVLADAGRHWKKLKHINLWNNQLDLGGVQSWAAVAHDWQGLEVRLCRMPSRFPDIINN
jgi:hypothetical protein